MNALSFLAVFMTHYAKSLTLPTNQAQERAVKGAHQEP